MHVISAESKKVNADAELGDLILKDFDYQTKDVDYSF